MNKQVCFQAFILFLLAISMAGSGCDERSEPVYVPATETEVDEFAAPFKKAFEDQHELYFKACTDHRRMAWRSVKGELTGRRLDEFTNGLKEGFSMPEYFSGQLGAGLQHMHVLGTFKRGEEWVLRMRLTDLGEAELYLDLCLEKRTDDIDTRVVVTDLYFFTIGDWASKAMGENMVMMGLDLNDLEKEVSEEYARFNRIVDLYEEGETEEAEELWEELPDAMQNSKSIQLDRLFALMYYDSTKFSNAFASFRREFPTDESLADLDIRWALYNLDGKGLIEAVGRMKQVLGAEDGYQNHLIGYAYLEMGRREEAIIASERSVEMEPEVDYFRDQWMTSLIGLQKYDEAIVQWRLLIANDYLSEVNYGGADPGFYESKAFLALKKEDPERWEFLDADWDGDLDEEWEDQDSIPDYEQ
jgi:tetratricopeptide (TPR) repeat protein